MNNGSPGSDGILRDLLPGGDSRQNGLDPFSYLHYVFQQAPHINTAVGWDDLLPQNLTAEKLAAALPTPLRHS